MKEKEQDNHKTRHKKAGQAYKAIPENLSLNLDVEPQFFFYAEDCCEVGLVTIEQLWLEVARCCSWIS